MMPHIDEGALHAYLDGALDEYPASEAERVREHLDQCGGCRERLESERALRDQASHILSVAAPHVEAPAFEELRAYQRVRTAGRDKAPRRLARIGWAASVILAVGAGWALRGGPSGAATAGDGIEPDAPSTVAQGTPDAPVALTARDAGGPEAGASASAAELGGTVVADGPAAPEAGPSQLLPSRTDLEPFSVEVATFQDAGPPAIEPDLNPDAPPLPQAPSLEPLITGSSQVVADAGAPVGDPVPEAPRTTELERSRSPADVVTSARTVEAPRIGPFGRNADDASDAGDAGADEEVPYSLVVPNLEVLDVRFRGGVRPEGQVVLQRLESGDTLEVIHLPSEIGPSTLDDADPEDRELVLETGSGWIVMRAPVGEDALMELMRRLLDEN